MFFPQSRPRRLRQNENIRRLVRETNLQTSDLIMPLFVVEGKGIKKEIEKMPGQFHLSIDELVKKAKEIKDLGIPAILLFGLPNKKDNTGKYAHMQDGIVQRAVRELKNKVPDILIITDVCLCGYMTHGHCGFIENNKIDNDISLEILSKTALSHARAGADIVAPSDMMDGRVAEIRQVLDENNFIDTAILSYAIKYCSSFYGPFRQAANSSPQFGDRKTYQMDPSNFMEAIKEANMDVEEGADIIMVKPALSYLDIISSISSEIDLPIAAYSTSGEYSIIKAGGKMGFIDEEKVMLEVALSIKRAGAKIIISYFACDIAKLLKQDKYL